MTFGKGSTVVALVLGVVAQPALAQKTAEEPADAPDPSKQVRITVGLKVWPNRWETWGFPSDTAKKIALIPSVAASRGNFFASLGYFTTTLYNFPLYGDVPRTEYDLNVGYWVLQSDSGRLGLTLGYKQVNEDFGAFKEQITAPTIGFTASAHIAGPWSLYSNAAFGPATETGPSFKARGYYASGEAGVAYAFDRGTAVTIGFKGQVIDVGLGDCAAFGNTRCRDTTDGFIFGVSHTF